MGLESVSGGGISRETHASITHLNSFIGDGELTFDKFNPTNSPLELNRVKLPTPAVSDYVTPSSTSASSIGYMNLWNDFEEATLGDLAWTFTDPAEVSLGDYDIEQGQAIYFHPPNNDTWYYHTRNNPIDLTNVDQIRWMCKYRQQSYKCEIDTVSTFDSADLETIWSKSLGSGINWTGPEEVVIDVSAKSGNWYIRFGLSGASGQQEARLYLDGLAEDSNSASNSKDDNTSTYWKPSPVNESGAWVEWDVGALKIIGGCRIYAKSGYAPTVKVEVSEDDTTWTEVATGVKLSGGVWKEITWKARYCRYIRITVTDYGTESGIQIAEMDYYSRISDRVASEHAHGSGVTPHLKGHGERIKPFRIDKGKDQKGRIEELEEQVQLLRDMTGV